MRLKKEAETALCPENAEKWATAFRGDVAALTMYALALYAGEGGKTDGKIVSANSDTILIQVFLRWLRTEFDIDERRLRLGLYLHADLDLDAAIAHWCGVTGIPPSHVNKPYRAVVDETMRHNRHEFGCVRVVYADTSLQRRVMAKIRAIGSTLANPG